MRIQLSLILILFGSFLTSCTSTSGGSRPSEGVQAAYVAYIPARIAIARCMQWPGNLSFPAQKLSNASAEEIVALCQRVDEFVLKGFDQQPFMQGMTPKLVSRLLEQAQPQNPGLLSIEQAVKNFWQSKTTCLFCGSCKDFYAEKALDSMEWRRWLQTFSEANRHADALLIPFVVHSYTDTVNDRGLILARRTASLSMLLINTNDASLIWTRERQGMAVREKLQTDPAASSLTSPPLEALQERLLTADVWQDFPGRKN